LVDAFLFVDSIHETIAASAGVLGTTLTFLLAGSRLFMTIARGLFVSHPMNTSLYGSLKSNTIPFGSSK
jgi:hypothetical protein